MNNRIGVIGIGRLGLSFALLAERSGYHVFGCDSRRGYIQSLNDLSYTTSEPFVEQYLKETKNLQMTSMLGYTIDACDILFCFVATPSLPDGSYDHSAIDRVVQDLQELHLRGQDFSNKILVIGCTTMPGYTDTVYSRLENTEMSVVYNPEFIAQGSIINDLRNADIVLIGCREDSSYHALEGIYRTIMDKVPVIKRMSPTAAELTKISVNCFLTMKIAYANMIGEIAINTGIEDEVSTVLGAIGSDSRVGNKYLQYGFGYGGPCLVRDNRAINAHGGIVGVPRRLPSATDQSNDLHALYLIEYCTTRNTNKDMPFIFTQLTYKKGCDLLTESQQYRLCRDLLEMGYKVDITETDAVLAIVKKELAEYGDRVTYSTITNGFKIEIWRTD